MADFVVTIDGVNIPVQGVSSQAEANAAVAGVVKNNKNFVNEQREAFVQTGGSSKNRFLIGAGDTVAGVGAFLTETALRAAAQPKLADEVAADRARDKAIFEELDNRQIGMEDLGQNAFAIIGGASAGVRMLGSFALGGFGIAKSALSRFLPNTLKTFGDKGIREFVEQAATKEGKQLAKQLGDMTTEQADDVAKRVAQLRAQGRQAQVNANRQLRAQDAAPVSNTNLAQAVQAGETGARQAASATAQRAAQQKARQQAVEQAQKEAAIAAREQALAREQSQFRELIKQATNRGAGR